MYLLYFLCWVIFLSCILNLMPMLHKMCFLACMLWYIIYIILDPELTDVRTPSETTSTTEACVCTLYRVQLYTRYLWSVYNLTWVCEHCTPDPELACSTLYCVHLQYKMDYYQTMRNDYVHKAMYPEVRFKTQKV